MKQGPKKSNSLEFTMAVSSQVAIGLQVFLTHRSIEQSCFLGICVRH